ncbi:MAG: glutamate-1-semialdehyde aminotransferase [Candidatus Entotheonella factor]|uniref:Glutamate-1-semialdehyde 2,1-aminomutase n=1 Tax=Entotheonella factor TaxID=1429438 RepID=W4LR18_ENTF1|nr:MAG: glutamate-1-semialdehyde aminotransferase [Candidatus Entotheonella factor]
MTVQDFSKSAALFEQAQQLIPGGVNSPVRAYRSVDMEPPFIQRAEGSRVYDVDGNTYIDYVGSWGPMILGHAHPQVVAAVQGAAASGCSFGAPTELEVQLAQRIVDAFPAMEMVRMVNSGTEATMSAIRLARGYTGRDRIIKFSGCYHGHGDSLLVKAGSGAMTFGVPDSPGVPADLAKYTLTLPFNDLNAVRQALEEHPGQIACVILEPAVGNMGLVKPDDGFLEGLRQVTREHDTLLIFDEVMTGFRVDYGGMQTLYNIDPDLTTLGKVIGGGLPVGAYGGKREIVEHMSPVGPIYQAGTLSGNPLAMTAGLTTLDILRADSPYKVLGERAAHMMEETAKAAREANVPVYTTSIGSMFTVFFSDKPVRNFEDASACDIPAFRRYFSAMLQAGIYIAPSQYEAGFLSIAHTDEDIETTLRAGAEALKSLS